MQLYTTANLYPRAVVSCVGMSESQIVREIEHFAQRDYGNWYIGVTDDPERRRVEHNNPAIWHDWDAESQRTARAIERYFLARGMDGGVGGGVNPRYIYIYKLGAISLQELFG